MQGKWLFLSGVWAGLFAAVVAVASAAEPPMAERYLAEGRLAAGEKALTAHLKQQPDDDEARFGLGAIQFVQAVERLSQSLYEYGALGPQSRLGRQIPFLRLAVPRNLRPKEVRYADVRAILQRLVDDLTRTEATLAPIKDKHVKLPLHFGLVRLDMNGDGAAGDDETLWRIYASLNGGLRLGPDFQPADAEAFVIGFDYADVLWLRGYCHLLSSLAEVALAYDQQPVFDAVGRQLFDNPASPAIPAALVRQPQQPFEDEIADAIAAIHLSHFAVQEPDRMKSAHVHLRRVIALSRESWQAIQAEADNDHEWIPSSTQQSVIPQVRVTADMIAGWHDFLNEADGLLVADKLVPHWRFNSEYGINLRRVFEEPQEFDLVLWVHGAAAVPYAERGKLTSLETWQRLERLFGGQFIGFAFWFN